MTSGGTLELFGMWTYNDFVLHMGSAGVSFI